MPTRRQFLATAGSTLAASAMSAAPAHSDPVLRLGLLADCQYVDAPDSGKRFYRQSPGKLREAITELNKHDLAFSFHLDGMLDTKDQNAYAHAALFPDRLEITGFGRQESHRLTFR